VEVSQRALRKLKFVHENGEKWRWLKMSLRNQKILECSLHLLLLNSRKRLQRVERERLSNCEIVCDFSKDAKELTTNKRAEQEEDFPHFFSRDPLEVRLSAMQTFLESRRHQQNNQFVFKIHSIAILSKQHKEIGAKTYQSHCPTTTNAEKKKIFTLQHFREPGADVSLVIALP
jgi:hypothetical protein